MNYRVYVKRAKDNIIGDVVRGSINSQGVATEYPTGTHWYITKSFLSVDSSHTYELVKIFDSNVSYVVYEYNSDKTYLNRCSLQDRNGNDINKSKIYVPSSLSVSYVKLAIWDTTNYPDAGYFPTMFLRSADPFLIHDSNSPEKEYHLINSTLQLGDCTAGSFEFVIYPGHSYYQNKINLFTDTFYITRTYKNGSERIIWDGRAITEEIDADGNKAYHCEGALSYLNDIRVAKSRSQDSSSMATVYEFINNYIVAWQSDKSQRSNRMDRSFYSYKENGEYVDASSIFCDQGTRYAWNINYESGLKWLNDIQQTFGGHMKIRYRDYDSVKDDIICRSFTYVQDFDRTFTIPDFQNIKIDTRIKRGSVFSYKQNLSATRTVYIAQTDFTVVSGKTTRDYIKARYITPVDSKLVGNVTSEGQIDNTKQYWVVNNAYAVYKPEALRFSVLYANFGTDIFEAKKTSEINDFATYVIPRGMSIESSSGTESHIYLSTRKAYIDGKEYSYNPPKDKQGVEYASDALIDISLTKQYGNVEAIVDFESASTPQLLYDQAYSWFRDIKKKIVRNNIEISLVELCKTIQNNSSDPFSDPEYVDIWTQVYAEIPAFGITSDSPEKYYVSEMSIPLDDYLNTQVTLVNKASLISDSNIGANNMQGSTKGIIDTAS